MSFIMPLPSHCHVFVMSLSCLCHVFVMSLSCLCRVFVMSLSCICHSFVMSLTRLFHIFVMPFSHLCHVPIFGFKHLISSASFEHTYVERRWSAPLEPLFMQWRHFHYSCTRGLEGHPLKATIWRLGGEGRLKAAGHGRSLSHWVRELKVFRWGHFFRVASPSRLYFKAPLWNLKSQKLHILYLLFNTEKASFGQVQMFNVGH